MCGALRCGQHRYTGVSEVKEEATMYDPSEMVIYPRIVCFPFLDYIILIEHQLSAEFLPDESMKSGWDFHAVSGTVTTLPQRRY